MSRLSRAGSVLQILSGVIALAAYRELWQGGAAVTERLEEWLFMSSGTSPALVVLLAFWLLYRRWDRLRSLPPAEGAASLLGASLLGLVAIVSMAWATYTRASDLLIPSLMASALALGVLFRGTPGALTLGLPVLFLVFAVSWPAPLLNVVVWKLQTSTAAYAGWLLALLGAPSFVAGDRILRADETFQVIETCSGLRSMETLTMVSLLMAGLFRRKPAHALLIVALAPVTAFVCNGLRVLALVLAPRSELSAAHGVQGLLILAAGLLLLTQLDGLLARVFVPAAPRPSASARESHASGPIGPLRKSVAVALPMVLFVTSSITPRWMPPGREPTHIGRIIGTSLPPWQGEEAHADVLFLGSVGFRQQVARRYRSGSDVVELFVGIGNRSERRRSALSPKNGLPGSGWIVETSRRERPKGFAREARVQTLRSEGRRVLVYDWTEGAGSLSRESLISALALDRSRWRRERDPLVVRVSTNTQEVEGSAHGDAEARLARFHETLRPLLDRAPVIRR